MTADTPDSDLHDQEPGDGFPPIVDATPCWAKLEWANEQIARLENEVSRRGTVLNWLAENTPQALELCPFKVTL